jgi:hypothetical protein
LDESGTDLVYRRVRGYIKEHGLKIKAVAAKVPEMKESRVYDVLSGNGRMSLEEFEAICKNGLGVKPEIFF